MILIRRMVLKPIFHSGNPTRMRTITGREEQNGARKPARLSSRSPVTLSLLFLNHPSSI